MLSLLKLLKRLLKVSAFLLGLSLLLIAIAIAIFIFIPDPEVGIGERIMGGIVLLPMVGWLGVICVRSLFPNFLKKKQSLENNDNGLKPIKPKEKSSFEKLESYSRKRKISSKSKSKSIPDITEQEATAKKYIKNISDYVSDSILNDKDVYASLNKFKAEDKYLTYDEFKNAIEEGLIGAIGNFVDDSKITDTEKYLFEKFIRESDKNLGKNIVGERGKRLLNYYEILINVRNNTYKEQKHHPVGLMIGKDEKVIHVFEDVSAFTLNKKVKFVGSSTGASYRLTKKTTIRHTGHRGRPVHYDEWDSVGSGKLAITNKHVIFWQGKRDLKERFSKITSIEAIEDGILINLNLKTRPAVRFKLKDGNLSGWFAGNLLIEIGGQN